MRAVSEGVRARPRRRWVHARLVGERRNKKRRETDLLVSGRREVEGQPPDGPREWGPHELEGDIDDLSRGLRCAVEA